MPRLRMAVIGVGHLGKEHARILAAMPEVELVGVVDVSTDQAQAVARRCNTTAFGDYWPLLNLVDAATIVVPTSYHHAIACEFLRRGIPLLVEKPLAATVEQANEMVEAAARQGVTLQVGHIERFNPAFEEMQRHPLQPKFIECQRLGPFTGRSTDIGAVLDLMIHDLDLLTALVRAPLRSAEALGVALFGKHEDIANARLTFENGCVAQLTASRANATAVRRMNVWAPEGCVGLDFARRSLSLVQPTEQLRRLGQGARKLDPATAAMLRTDLFGRFLETQTVDCNQPKQEDQLTRELRDFVKCAQTGERPRVSGEDGRDAILLASRILDSIHAHAWQGNASGPVGPAQLPAPSGELFPPAKDEAAA